MSTRSTWSVDAAAGRTVRLLLVAAALYLGAPFWFDVVRRLSGARRSGARSET